MSDETFQWPDPPGEEWWKSAGADCGATETQIKFAALRFAGGTASACARGAGYAGDSRSLRSSAYAALRSNGVKRLLAMAETERVGTADIPEATSEEIKKTLSGLLRSQDPTVKLRAAEQLTKMESAERAVQAERVHSSADEVILELLKMDGSLFVAAGLLFEHSEFPWGNKATSLLAPVVKRDYPDLWARARARFAAPSHVADFDALGNAPALSMEEVIARLEAHVIQEKAR
jgi:hypothetical protein